MCLKLLLHTVMTSFYRWTCCFNVFMHKIPLSALLSSGAANTGWTNWNWTHWGRRMFPNHWVQRLKVKCIFKNDRQYLVVCWAPMYYTQMNNCWKRKAKKSVDVFQSAERCCILSFLSLFVWLFSNIFLSLLPLFSPLFLSLHLHLHPPTS